jgi:hypothetical protein
VLKITYVIITQMRHRTFSPSGSEADLYIHSPLILELEQEHRSTRHTARHCTTRNGPMAPKDEHNVDTRQATACLLEIFEAS